MLVYNSFPNNEILKQIEYPQYVKLSPHVNDNYLHTNYTHGNTLQRRNNVNGNVITTSRQKLRMMYCLNQYNNISLQGTRICNGIPLQDESTINNKFSFPDLVRVFDCIQFYRNYLPLPKLNVALPPIKSYTSNNHIKYKETDNTSSNTNSSIKSRKSNKTQQYLSNKWWKLLKHFIHIYTFLSFIKKYTKQSIIRKQILRHKRKFLPFKSNSTKSWIFSLLSDFLNNLLSFSTNQSISFTSTKPPNSTLITSSIKLFMQSITSQTSSLSSIPLNIQDILYETIKHNSFHLKQYMTVYMARRLQFSVYGSTINLNSDQISFLLAFVIIGGYVIQDVLVKKKVVCEEWKRYKYLEGNMKVIGSIMYYMMKEEFERRIERRDDMVSMINYYRTYHILSKKVESLIGKDGILKEGYDEVEDSDVYENELVEKKEVLKFWEMNGEFVKDYGKFIYDWGCKLGEVIRRTYLKKEKGGEGYGDGFAQRIRRPAIVSKQRKK